MCSESPTAALREVLSALEKCVLEAYVFGTKDPSIAIVVRLLQEEVRGQQSTGYARVV